MKPIVGIDIGKCFVKIIQLEKKLSLTKCCIFPTPYTKNGDLDTHQLIKRLTSHIPLNLLKKSQIGINIPSSSVRVALIHLPQMTKKEMSVAVATEIKRKMVPPPSADSIFEYSILKEVVIENVPLLEILVVETKKEHISRILDIFTALGQLYPVLITPTCATLANCFPHIFEFQQKNVAFVDIGYDSLDIAIVKRGGLDFYRTIKFGLKEVISYISQTSNLSLEKAEEIVKEMGIPQIDVDLEDRVKIAEEIMREKYEVSEKKRDKISPLEIRLLWQTNIERMIQEIRRTLIYYKEQSKGERIDEVYFLGGGAKIKGLIDVVSKKIGGVIIFDPFKNMEINLTDEEKKNLDLKSLFIPALSIALTIPLIRKRKVINFLPEELKRKEIAFRRQVGVVFVSALIFCFVFLGWLNLFIATKIIASTVVRLKVERRRKEKILRKMEYLEKEKVEIESKAKGILEKEKERKDLSLLLKEIVNILPQEVFLTRLTIEKPKSIKEKGIQSSERFASMPSSNRSQKVFPSVRLRGVKKTGSIYELKMEIACVADYEQAIELAYYCKGILEDSSFFTDVILSPPEVKKITPSMGGFKQIELTPVALRTFKIRANVKIPE